MTPETDAATLRANDIDGGGEFDAVHVQVSKRLERERDEARLAILTQMAREHLTCGWCGDMMHAPPGFTPPMTTEKLKQTVKIHMLDCPKHPIRETEREVEEAEAKLEELRQAVRNVRDVKGRHHTQLALERLIALLTKNA